MQKRGMMSGFYSICEWIMRFAYLNILWMFFTLCGLIVFGFFPATTAMFAVVRKWVMKESDVPIFKSFWGFYKNDLLKGNLLGLTLVVIGYILYIDIMMLQHKDSILHVFYIPSLVITLAFVLTVFFVFPTYVHYDIKIFQVIKNAFFIMVTNLVPTFFMFAGSTIFYYFLRDIPGLIPFLSGSVLAYIFMWSASLAFAKIQKGHESSISQ